MTKDVFTSSNLHIFIFFPEDIKQRQTQRIAAQIQAKHILVQAKHILAVSQHAEMQGCHAMLRHFVSNPRLYADIGTAQIPQI